MAEAPTQTPSTAAASPSKPAPATLTAKNNREFARVLKADDCDEVIDTFATDRAGRTVEFAGIIVDLTAHDGARTRYEILIAPGNTVEATKGR
jgi:hypothetical protein